MKTSQIINTHRSSTKCLPIRDVCLVYDNAPLKTDRVLLNPKMSSLYSDIHSKTFTRKGAKPHDTALFECALLKNIPNPNRMCFCRRRRRRNENAVFQNDTIFAGISAAYCELYMNIWVLHCLKWIDSSVIFYCRLSVCRLALAIEAI